MGLLTHSQCMPRILWGTLSLVPPHNQSHHLNDTARISYDAHRLNVPV
jgi:hypothetical protein